MRISELTSKLLRLCDEHGDLEVMIPQSATDFEGIEHIWNAKILFVGTEKDEDGKTFIEIC